MARAQEGVRPGQRLLALSDPIRGAEMWPITPSTSSLSRVRDAFKLRRAPTVDLVVSAASVEDQLEGAPAARRPRSPRVGAAAARAALQASPNRRLAGAARPPVRRKARAELRRLAAAVPTGCTLLGVYLP